MNFPLTIIIRFQRDETDGPFFLDGDECRELFSGFDVFEKRPFDAEPFRQAAKDFLALIANGCVRADDMHTVFVGWNRSGDGPA